MVTIQSIFEERRSKIPRADWARSHKILQDSHRRSKGKLDERDVSYDARHYIYRQNPKFTEALFEIRQEQMDAAQLKASNDAARAKRLPGMPESARSPKAFVERRLEPLVTAFDEAVAQKDWDLAEFLFVAHAEAVGEEVDPFLGWYPKFRKLDCAAV